MVGHLGEVDSKAGPGRQPAIEEVQWEVARDAAIAEPVPLQAMAILRRRAAMARKRRPPGPQRHRADQHREAQAQARAEDGGQVPGRRQEAAVLGLRSRREFRRLPLVPQVLNDPRREEPADFASGEDQPGLERQEVRLRQAQVGGDHLQPNPAVGEVPDRERPVARLESGDAVDLVREPFGQRGSLASPLREPGADSERVARHATEEERQQTHGRDDHVPQDAEPQGGSDAPEQGGGFPRAGSQGCQARHQESAAADEQCQASRDQQVVPPVGGRGSASSMKPGHQPARRGGTALLGIAGGRSPGLDDRRPGSFHQRQQSGERRPRVARGLEQPENIAWIGQVLVQLAQPLEPAVRTGVLGGRHQRGGDRSSRGTADVPEPVTGRELQDRRRVRDRAREPAFHHQVTLVARL